MGGGDFIDAERAYSQPTWSIEAEDILVERIFYHLVGNPEEHQGFYVDLGACDPFRASNTYRLYKRGWRGLNVEANPDALPRFLAARPRDTNLNLAIGADGEVGIYTSFDEPLLNGFLPKDVVAAHINRGARLLNSTNVSMRSINRVLSENVAPGAVDYLNIDIEMMEHAILSEWDFSRWNPKVISVEIHGPADIIGISRHPVALLLAQRGYTFVSRLWHTSIFARIR